MPRPIKRISKAKGLPPGTLVHIGEKKVEKVKMTKIIYDVDHFDEKECLNIEECLAHKDEPGVHWINIDGIHQTDIIQKIGDKYGLHPLVLEDIVNTDQRPKMEDHVDYIYVVLKMLYLNDKGDLIVAEQISLVLGNNYVISFQEKQGDVFDPIRDRLRNNKGRIRKMGADYLAYALLDAVVDGYFVILERTGERMEALEQKVLISPIPKTLHFVHQLKSDMIFLRKSVWPLREVISAMMRSESKLISQNTDIYLRDVHDHTIQVVETIESYRETVTGLLDIYLSSISNRLNEVMKVLTIIATIFIPLTFIAGIYGMNFKYMPELGWPWGYPLVLGAMVLVGLVMVAYFKRKKWI